MLAPKPPSSPAARHVVFFDGDCMMCDGTVRTLMNRDRGNVLHFATLQGPLAQELIDNELLPATHDLMGTMVFAENYGDEENQRITLRSTAVLRICDKIGGVWRILSWTRVIPKIVRDGVYNFIAANRYKWFGKREKEACFLPNAEQAKKFLS